MPLAFDPPPLPPNGLEQSLVGKTALVGRANAMLSRYDGLLETIVNPGVLLSPLLLKEAELSSRIEGTEATANEVYEHEAGEEFEPEKDADIMEIINYRSTLRQAADLIAAGQAIDLHMIRAMHQILMQGVRGQDKHPGEYRTTQNWIGPRGCPIDEATYVPPTPLRLQDHLDAFQSLLAIRTDELDPIVHSALIHAQFELIHPFDDGNGRIGRLLIPLYLYARRCLNHPSFYLSGYFERHRDRYMALLGRISTHDDWAQWLDFYLTAVVTQAETNTEQVRRIISLYNEMKDKVAEATHSQQTIQIVDALFNSPVFPAANLHRHVGITRDRGAKYVRMLAAAGLISEIRPSAGRRSALMAFDALLDITA